MVISPLKRLEDILKRELDARDVHISSDSDSSDLESTIALNLGRSRLLVVTFSTPPMDLQDKRARLEALSQSFPDLFADAARELPTAPRKPVQTLQSELNVLAGHALATCAVIIDAKSPVIWGASEAATNPDEVPFDPHEHDAYQHLNEIGISWRTILANPSGVVAKNDRKDSKIAGKLRLVPPVDELANLSAPDRDIISERADLTRKAIARIRANPLLPQLHRGEHLHEAIVDESVAYVARSFATIYVLILVFPGQFDELGAERAMTRALPIIERLVISLPPDDTPNHRQGAVVALRPRRR